MPKLPCRFKLRVNKRYYYWAYVFPTRKAMFQHYYAACKEYDLRRVHPNFRAIMHGWRVWKNGKLTGELGQILFDLSYFGAGIVSHEMTHAALNWAHQTRTKNEEKICWVQGELVRKFWKKHWKLGLDKIK